jgi:hypothetical protein
MENEINFQPNDNLDEYHYHEALDRTFLIQLIIQESLSKHPVFQYHPELEKILDIVQDSLSDIYSHIGNIEFILQIPPNNDE